MTTQTLEGFSLSEIFPGLNGVLEHSMVTAGIFTMVAVIYFGIQWMMKHSRMEDAEADTFPYDLGFVTSISLPLILLAITASITGLVTGVTLGAILAAVMYFLLRRAQATQKRATLRGDSSVL